MIKKDKFNAQTEKSAKKHRDYSAANYLERMREAEEEDKKLIKLCEAQRKREKGGCFVLINPTTEIFVPAGKNINKAIQEFKNKMLERQNKW